MTRTDLVKEKCKKAKCLFFCRPRACQKAVIIIIYSWNLAEIGRKTSAKHPSSERPWKPLVFLALTFRHLEEFMHKIQGVRENAPRPWEYWTFVLIFSMNITPESDYTFSQNSPEKFIFKDCWRKVQKLLRRLVVNNQFHQNRPESDIRNSIWVNHLGARDILHIEIKIHFIAWSIAGVGKHG